jgi:hypothetical protein
MKRMLSRLFARTTARPPSHSTVRRTSQLHLEALEDRICPHATINLQTAQLIQVIYGTQTAVNVLQQQVMSDAKQLAADVYFAEVAKPTAQCSVIEQDALTLFGDAYNALNGNLANSAKVDGDVVALWTQMDQEYSQVGSQSLLKSNSTVLSDANIVVQDLQTNLAFATADNYFAGMSNPPALFAQLGFYIPSSSGTSTGSSAYSPPTQLVASWSTTLVGVMNMGPFST